MRRRRELIAILLARLQSAAELLMHGLIAQICDMADHTGYGQPGIWLLAVAVIIAVVPRRVGIDSLTADFAQSDQHRAMSGGGRQGNGRT